LVGELLFAAPAYGARLLGFELNSDTAARRRR